MEALEGPNARVPKTPLAAQQQGHQGLMGI